MPEPSPERQIVAELLTGTPEAAERLVTVYRPVVHEAIARLLARRLRGSADLAEDLTHEVFVALLRDGGAKLRTFQGRNGCSFAGWLRVVAVRLAIDVLRRDRRFGSLDDETPRMIALRRVLTSRESNPEERLQGSEALDRLRRLMTALAPKDRLLLELHLMRDAPLEDVARVLGVTMNAVYVRKSRLLDRLRESIGDVP